MKEALKFNDLDTYYKTDRRSLTGKYDVIQGVPRLGHVPFSLLGSFNKDNARSNESTKVCERGRIRGQGEGGHPDPEIRGGGAWPFEPQFGLKIRGTQVPSLDPPLGND